MAESTPEPIAISKGSLVLHAGLPKSGTTALQLFLNNHAREFGFTYLRHPVHDRLQSRFLFRSFTPTKRRLSDEKREVCLAWARRTAAAAGAGHILLSDEALSKVDFIDRQEFTGFCNEIAGGRPLVAVLYVRPFFSWLESLINQLTKNGNFDFHAFTPKALEHIGGFTLAFDKIAEFYRSAGFDTRIYEYPSDIVRDFSSRLGLDATRLPAAENRPNSSPDNFHALQEFARIRGSHSVDINTAGALAGRTFLSRKQAARIWETHGTALTGFEARHGLGVGAVNDYTRFLARASETGLIEKMQHTAAGQMTRRGGHGRSMLPK